MSTTRDIVRDIVVICASVMRGSRGGGESENSLKNTFQSTINLPKQIFEPSRRFFRQIVDPPLSVLYILPSEDSVTLYCYASSVHC